MATPALKPTGQAAADLQLLAQLGLPASASPEDVDQLHQAVSEFLAAAPAEIRGWARAQVAALDSAYIHLTDPVGLEGSALRSPASPPTVVPGGPATPPARRGPAPAGPAAEAAAVTAIAADAAVEDAETDDLDIEGEPTAEDLAALYAMVTPSVHDDMKPVARRPAAVAAPVAAPAHLRTGNASRAKAAAVAAPAPAATSDGPWKRIVIAGGVLAAAVALFVGVNAIVNSGVPSTMPPATAVAEATIAPPVVDEAKVADLMAKFQANPSDTETLMALGDEFYMGGQFETAGTWFDKLLAIEPGNVTALLARGASYFNLDDTANAETTWMKVVAVDPDNVEVHYDLGFLYLNQATPDYARVQAEWGRVVELDPGSKVAQSVQAHLDALVNASMIPASSAPATSPAAASPAASAAPSPAASPAASPATSTVP
jgi:Flp pilus assembly protein TadD